MKISKRFGTAACSLLLSTAFFALPIFADDVSEDAFGKKDEYVIESFDNSVGRFRAGKNVRSVAAHNVTLNFGEEYACLEAAASYCSVTELRTVTCKFSEATDLSDYRVIEYKIYVPLYEADADAAYYSRLTLYSADGSSTETLAEVKGGEWTTVRADISSFAGRDESVSLEIAYAVDTAKVQYVMDNFYIDDIVACDAVDRNISARYLFDRFELEGASGAMTDDGEMIVVSASSFDGFSLFADLFVPELVYDTGAIRIKLANGTLSDTLTLKYKTSDTKAVSEDKAVSIPIIPMSDATYYYAHVGDVSMLRSIELQFNKGGGNVEIYSLSAVPYVLREEYETCGNVNVCRLSDDLSFVNFYGEIDREVALENQDGRIAIYAYDEDVLPTADELSKLVPVVTGAMTTRFEFRWNLPSDNPHACYSRFIAVLLDSNGNYTLIAPPFCIDNPRHGSSVAKPFPIDEKGFSAYDVSTVGESDSGITLITVDIPRVFDAKANATPYIYNGRAYYINTEYVNLLSKKIAILGASGTDVILRYSGWNSDGLSGISVGMHSDTARNDYSSDNDTKIGSDFVGAFSAYTAEKWCGNYVVGVIFGDRENVIPEGEVSVADMISHTARELCKVYLNIIAVNSEAKVYISVTDVMDANPSTNVSELPINDYISALAAKTSEYGIYGFEIAVEVTERGEDFTGSTVKPNDCGALTDFLKKSGFENKHFIFCDSSYSDLSARLSTLSEKYVIGYYSSYFNGMMDAYIAVADENTSIAETVKCIDTTESALITPVVLRTLKVSDLSAVVEGYDKSKLSERRFGYTDAIKGEPAGIKGSYSYFVFDSAANLGELDGGYYCSDMHIVRDSFTALSAKLDSALYGDERCGEWMGISHTFEYTENLAPVSVIAVNMKLENVIPANRSSVPVKLVLHSADERFEADGEIYAGEWTTVYFDITDFGGIKNTQSLRLLVGGGSIESASLLVKDIKGLSSEYSDEALAEVIMEERTKKRTPDTGRAPDSYLWMGGAALVGVATVMTTVLLGRKKSDER